jgi:hypothetical protein
MRETLADAVKFDQLITLISGQLQDLVARAIERAIAPEKFLTLLGSGLCQRPPRTIGSDVSCSCGLERARV